MIIYIVLGIAADDIFVFFDAWKQSEHVDPEILDTKEKRLAYSWRRAVKAMAVTSSTTAVAFFANAFSSSCVTNPSPSLSYLLNISSSSLVKSSSIDESQLKHEIKY